jgi:hypothetical protein
VHGQFGVHGSLWARTRPRGHLMRTFRIPHAHPPQRQPGRVLDEPPQPRVLVLVANGTVTSPAQNGLGRRNRRPVVDGPAWVVNARGGHGVDEERVVEMPRTFDVPPREARVDGRADDFVDWPVR